MSEKPDAHCVVGRVKPKANVLLLPAEYYQPTLHANQCLRAAIDKLKNVTLVGTQENGELYVAATFANPNDALYQLERAKQFLMEL